MHYVQADSLEAQERLGSTGHHPRWAVALRFPAHQGTTVVRAIEVQVGKSGVSGTTDHVVVGEAPGHKLADARRLRVPILEENEFLRLIEEA